jgi:hypothetical protein
VPQLEAGAAPLPIKQRNRQRGGNGVPATGRRRHKRGEKNGAIANEPFSEQPNRQELNLREKLAEVVVGSAMSRSAATMSGTTTTT